MKKCPNCNSTRLRKLKNILKCNNCRFINTNYKEVKIEKRKSKIKHIIFREEILKQIKNIEIFQIFYIEILRIFLNNLNQIRDLYKEKSEVGIILDELDYKFLQNLKGFFEQLEEKWKIQEKIENGN